MKPAVPHAVLAEAIYCYDAYWNQCQEQAKHVKPKISMKGKSKQNIWSLNCACPQGTILVEYSILVNG